MIGGARYPANQGGAVDVESADVVAQVKHRRVCSLAELERLAVELATLGRSRGKLGVVVVKRRAGAGRPTPRLVVCVESVWREVRAQNASGAVTRDSGMTCGPVPGRRDGPTALTPYTSPGLYGKSPHTRPATATRGRHGQAAPCRA